VPQHILLPHKTEVVTQACQLTLKGVSCTDSSVIEDATLKTYSTCELVYVYLQEPLDNLYICTDADLYMDGRYPCYCTTT